MTDRMMDSPRRRRHRARRRSAQLLVPGAVALIVLALASFSLVGIGHQSVRQSSQQTVSHIRGSSTGGSMAHSSTTSLGATESAVIGDSDRYKITVYDLRRHGPFLTLDFGIVCQAAGSNDCRSKVDFDGSNFADANVFNTVAGVVLVDPVQQKEYQEVQDSKNECFCSGVPSSMRVGPTTHLAWANFPAPPASVTSLDVAFVNGGPEFSAVPITRGPAQDPSGPQVVPAAQAHFDRPAGSTSTTGLKRPVLNLVDRAGSGGSWSYTQSGGQATMTLSGDVMFDFDSADLSPAAQSVLATVAAKIKAGGQGVVTVTGYTDSVGPASVNIPLSQARAQAVVTALTPLVAGAPVTFQAAGLGSADPIAPNTLPDGADNPAGRAQNRRVTISFSVNNAAALADTAATSSASPASMPAANSADYVANASAVKQMDHYHVAVNSLVREGNLAVLHLTITCTSATNDSGSGAAKDCDGASDLSGTNTIPPQTNSPSDDLNATTGLYLTDPTGQQIYAPIRDSRSAPLVTMTDPDWPVGNTYPIWMYFPAPTNLGSVTIQLPGGCAHISNIPVANGNY
jgi:outer membrane protein OmpA-like peptidoglycan-associated protein